MSETLQGVIIGGIIGIVGGLVVAIINIIYSYKIWKKEKQLEYLKQKKEKLEKHYKEALEKLEDGIEKDYIPKELLFDFEFLSDHKVKNAFVNFLKDINKTKEIKRDCLEIISITTQKHLAEIEQEIRELLKICGKKEKS